MHISLTGDLGSGKSTVAKMLATSLHYQFLSTGMIQRELALQQGMDTLQFNKYTDNNSQIDDYIDQHLKDVNSGTASYVLDSRLAWFFIPTSFKVYLLAFDQVAAERILADKDRIGEPNAADVHKKIKDSHERRASENTRFEKTYGVTFDLLSNFDLVIDTSFASINTVHTLILDAYKHWQNHEAYNKLWFAPQRIWPTQVHNAAALSEADAMAKSIDTTDVHHTPTIDTVANGARCYVYGNHTTYTACLLAKAPLAKVHILARNSELAPNGIAVANFVEGFGTLNLPAPWQDSFGIAFE